MKSTHTILVAFVISTTALIGGCHSGYTTAPSETQTPSASVTVSRIQPGTIVQILDAYGTVEYPPQAQSTISALAESVIEQIEVNKGQSVKYGDVLLTTRPSAASLRELAGARTDANAAQHQLARTQRLFAQQLATRTDLSQAQQAAANARSTLQSAQQRIASSGTMALRADRDATVVDILVAKGDIVAADAPLLRLASTGDVMVRLGIEPADAERVHTGMPVRVQPVYANSQALNGHIGQIMEQVDPQTRLLQATVVLAQHTGLLPGANVQASIEIARHDNILSAPRSAILDDNGHAYAFIDKQGKAKKVSLQTGIRNAERIEVIAGLVANDQIITSGNHELEEGMALRISSASKKAPAQ